MDAVWTPDQHEPPHRPVIANAKTMSSAESGRPGTPGHHPGRFAAGAKAGSKGCILVVDDDDSVRETLADVLEVVGYVPNQARDAAEALMILRQDPAIVALVTDLTMPGADGIELIRHARSIRTDLPAILLTGYAEKVASVGTTTGGDFHVLRKPVQSERLIEQLELLVTKTSSA